MRGKERASSLIREVASIGERDDHRYSRSPETVDQVIGRACLSHGPAPTSMPTIPTPASEVGGDEAAAAGVDVDVDGDDDGGRARDRGADDGEDVVAAADAVAADGAAREQEDGTRSRAEAEAEAEAG